MTIHHGTRFYASVGPRRAGVGIVSRPRAIRKSLELRIMDAHNAGTPLVTLHDDVARAALAILTEANGREAVDAACAKILEACKTVYVLAQ